MRALAMVAGVCAGLLVATVPSRTARAQSASKDSSKSPGQLCGSFNRAGISSVAGIVREANGAPIPYATVSFEGGYTTTTVAERSGCFGLRSPRNNQLVLVVRRIGFKEFLQPVDLHGDSTVFVDVRLSSIAATVNGVTVTAPRNDAMEKTGFYDRLLERTKGAGDGYFITPEDIEQRHEPKVTQLLEGYPSITVAYDTIARNGQPMPTYGGYVSGVGRAAISSCRMAMFLDGARVPNSQSIDELVGPTAISAIEIYPSAMQTPPQFQSAMGDAACGAVVAWTQRPDFTRRAGNWFKENLLTILALPVIAAAVIYTLGRGP